MSQTRPYLRSLEVEVVVRGAESLGIKRGHWVTAFSLPTTGEIWYREFYYKADAEKLRQEIIQHFHSLEWVLEHYGAKYWTKLQERGS